MNTIKVNDKKYQIIKLLGKGKGGYSYLVTDNKNNYVCKQIHHEPCSYYTFSDKLKSELNDYDRLNKIGLKLPRLYEADVENERILKEYIHGNTIYEKVLYNQMNPIYYEQIYEMSELCKKNHVNIDYYPTNFVIQNDCMYYIDYECNEYIEEWNYENWGIKYWSKTEDFLKTIIGKEIEVMIDRPLGSTHPNDSNMIYPINYGYVEGIMANDEEEQDVYVLGINVPIDKVQGKIIAIIIREDDNEEKWVISVDDKKYTKEEIEKQVFFCEQYFKSKILM